MSYEGPKNLSTGQRWAHRRWLQSLLLSPSKPNWIHGLKKVQQAVRVSELWGQSHSGLE